MSCIHSFSRVAAVTVTLFLSLFVMQPIQAEIREQRVTTPLATYVLRSDEDEDKPDLTRSSSVIGRATDGREILFQDLGLVVGCWEFSPRAIEVTGRSGRRVSVALLCGSPGGGRYETLIAIRDGSGELASLEFGNETVNTTLTSDGRLVAVTVYLLEVPGIGRLLDVPMQYELNVDAKPLRFDPVRGHVAAARVQEMLRVMRQDLSSSHDAEAYFASAHAILGERACAHLHRDLPGLWKLLGDAELSALNRWIASEFSLKECKRHGTHRSPWVCPT